MLGLNVLISTNYCLTNKVQNAEARTVRVQMLSAIYHKELTLWLIFTSNRLLIFINENRLKLFLKTFEREELDVTTYIIPNFSTLETYVKNVHTKFCKKDIWTHSPLSCLRRPLQKLGTFVMFHKNCEPKISIYSFWLKANF